MLSSPLQAERPIAFTDLNAQHARIAAQIERAVLQVMQHGQYVMGPEVRAFEADLCRFSGARHAVSCGNGTDALMLVMMAEDIGPGDAVIVPSFTFVATAEAVASRGATPVFADVDPATFNIDLASLDRTIAAINARDDLNLRMVVAVDLFGRPADYTAIRSRADAHGFTVVADAAQSFGATLRGRSVGTLADYTTTSFFPSKPLGCYGDGGAVLTGDDNAAERLRSLRIHGKGADKYDNVRIGLNSRLDTLQAAILLEKLRIFPDEIDARNAAAARYGELLADKVGTPSFADGSTSVWAQYTTILPAGADRARIQASCRAAGVPTNVYYPIPMHHQTGYRNFPSDPKGLQSSEFLCEHVLSLPMHPYLDAAIQERVAAALEGALGE